MAKQIVIDHVFKVFGDDPQEALALVRQGLSKQEVLARTGQSIGVFDAHLSIEAGEIFVVMGLSGSGKSTLVRLLNLLIEPSAGRILVDGVDIAQLPDAQLRALRRKDISMVFQSFALMPHMTVLDNTALGLELAGVDVGPRWANVANHLALRLADHVLPFLDLQYLYGLARADRPEADALLANPKLLQTVFADDALRSKRNTEAVEVGPNQLVAARVLQHRPAATRPLAEVSAQVRQALVQQRALELAKAEGKARLVAWKGGAAAASLPAAIVVSRQQAQGLPQSLVSALLSARVDKGQQPGWAGVDLGAQGYAVARINQVLAPETLAAAQAEQGRQQLAQMWAQAEAQAYLEALKKHYKVKILTKS